MVKIANTYYSIAHPKVLKIEGKRIAEQIIACFKYISPQLSLRKCQVLDVGSSDGSITYHIAPYVLEIVGIDVDKSAIKHGNQKYKRSNFKLSVFGGKTIPYVDNLFDLVVFRRTYGSTDNPKKLTQEIFRVLKPSGLCYFEGHNKLFIIEGDHWIPFLTIMPNTLARWMVLLLRQKTYYYIERYQTLWEAKKLFSGFQIHMLTPLIMKYPQKFGFIRLYSLNMLTRIVPLSILKLIEPFLYPDFIWILKKPS